MKKVIKLINNERVKRSVMSAKASLYPCEDPTATDVCTVVNYDNAHCTVGATDLCTKDLAACTKYAVDYCDPGYDVHACIGSGNTDY